VLAANAQAQAAEDEVIEEIITTGTRLKANPNLAAAIPILSVAGAEGEIRGNVRIEDFINVLPQVFAGQASEVANGASGTATLDLRGLGSQRTLVLIDGRRLPYGASRTSSANLDVIPLQMVERVDILTGGASAVYGSDAIGGVANFILKRDFEGVEFGYQYGSSYNSNSDGFWQQVLESGNQPVPGSNSDGKETLIYGMLGVDLEDGRGNVTLFASYEDREAIWQSDRIYSGCALGQDDGATSYGGFGCVGSANYRLMNGGPDGIGYFFQEEDGTMVPWAGGPAQTFNFGPFNFFQRPSERYLIYGKGYVEVADNVEAFMDISYTNNVSDAQIAPTASFGLGSYSINCDNPFLQDNPGVLLTDVYGCTDADIAAGAIKTGIGASHRNVEGGPRNSRFENSALRLVTGLRGSFGDDVWDWETFAQISETRDQSESTNDFVVANLQQAFLVTTDANGNAVCIDPSGGCAPYNIFQRGPAGETLVTPEAISFIHGIGLRNGQTSQLIYGGSIQADLGEYGWKVPSADYGVSFLVGFEGRTDKLDARPDEISQVPGGGFTGVGGATLAVQGEVDVTEFFTEVEVPLVTGMTGIQELTLRGQFRTSDYEGTGNNTTNPFDADAYGLSLAWAPIDDLRFRTQYQKAVRAPNVIALYTGQNTGLPNLSSAGTNANGVQLFDPCASDAPIATLAACQNTGVTAAQYGSIFDVISGQTQSLSGGNPDLIPESADTVTFGFVWTGVDSLSVSIDYFTILVEDAISAGIPAQTTLDNCLASGNPQFCDLINRGPGGTLAAGDPGVGFQMTNINIAELETTGVDLQVLYDFDVGAHSVRLDYAATILDQGDFVPYPGADSIECAGRFGTECGAPNPEYRHRIVATWQTPWPVDVSATWRYFGGTDNDNETETLETELDTVNYLDLAASWLVMDDIITIRASILNVLGEDPPIFSGAGPALGNGNTYPTVYDTSTTYIAGFKFNF
jgi:outer membrane receptor protein involved in Fe transport